MNTTKKFVIGVYMMVLPFTTWQVYKGGILTVYSGSDAKSAIVYSGAPDGYHGEATQPTPNRWFPWMSQGSSTTTPAN